MWRHWRELCHTGAPSGVLFSPRKGVGHESSPPRGVAWAFQQWEWLTMILLLVCLFGRALASVISSQYTEDEAAK